MKKHYQFRLKNEYRLQPTDSHQDPSTELMCGRGHLLSLFHKGLWFR
nr:MAG TPA: hypothetical protein [Caudoviricetes sp.]